MERFRCSTYSRIAQRSSFFVGLLLLSAAAGCSGENSPPPPATPASFVVSGTIRSSGTVLADSDVNDPLAAFSSNDQFMWAQRLPNPATVGGYVNVPGSGPSGRSRSGGDRSDFFHVALASGQSINLFIAENTAANLDLFLYDSSRSQVASSENPSGNESVTSPADDIYFIEVRARSGASNYILTIGQATDPTGWDPAKMNLDFVPGEVIVKFTGAALLSRNLTNANNRIEELGMYTRAGTTDREMLLGFENQTDSQRAFRALGIEPQQQTPRFADPLVQRKMDTLRIIQALRRRPDVDYAEPNFIWRPLAAPNDTFYPIMWHLPLINLPQAWNITTGSAAVIVAVVDTGLLLDHPDVRGNLDPVNAPGYDFIRDPALSGDGDGIDSNPDDPAGFPYHGTHVAGTIAAVTDNALGVAGVAWDTSIMPMRALARDVGTVYDVMQAVRYAARLPNDSGILPPVKADIINLSLGSEGFSQTASDVFEQVRSEGVIVIAAAGNSSSSAPFYPAAYNPVVSVNAVDINKNLAWYSNFGSTVDLAAPGGDLGADVNADGFPDGVLSTCGDNRSGPPIEFVYCFFEGTSMAAPHVAGIAALMKAIHPALGPADFDLLIQGDLITDGGAAERDDEFGFGLIDAFKAVDEARGLAAGTPLPATLLVDPAFLNFGTVLTAEILRVNNGGEKLTGVTVISDQPWLSVAASNVDADGIGEYTVTVDRSTLADGIYSAVITVDAKVDTTGADIDDVTIPVSLNQDNTPVTGGDAGFHYVLLLDANDRNVVAEDAVAYAGSGYRYHFADIPAGTYLVVAGTDFDNDFSIGDRGEAYGTYLTVDQPLEVVISGDTAGLDFETGFDVALPAGQGRDAPVPQLILERPK